MKNYNYLGLWLLLTVVLSLFVCVSFADDLVFMGWTIKKSSIAESLLERVESEEENLSFDSIPLPNTELETDVVETDSLPQSIFIFGDSMTFNLALRLAQYAKQNGHQIHSVNWDSSNTKIWAEHDTLANCLARIKPSFVFISLGSNELFIQKPEKRIPYIKKILEVIDTIPYVWIGPPNWQEDGGINRILEETCRKGTFFKSEGIELARKKDNIHPTRSASALWVDSIMRWLPSSAHPFVADVPDDSIGKANPHIVFLKALNK